MELSLDVKEALRKYRAREPMKQGDTIRLSAKGLALRPDLKGETGIISYRPIMAKQLYESRMHTHYSITLENGEQYLVPANQIEYIDRR